LGLLFSSIKKNVWLWTTKKQKCWAYYFHVEQITEEGGFCYWYCEEDESDKTSIRKMDDF